MVKTYQVISTERVKLQVFKIAEYLLDEVSYDVAMKVQDGIINSFQKLSRFPHAHQIEHSVSSKTHSFRRYYKWSYKVIFIIQEAKDLVVVVDVSHSSEDPQDLIKRFL